MRLMAWLVMLVSSCPVLAQEKPVRELEKLQSDGVEARKAAAADPTIKNAASKPVVTYLIEQKRRRLTSIAGLRQRIEKHQADKSQEKLIPVLKDQLAELERKPLEQVSFDAAYGYQPTTGLVGYSKKVRLIENTSDGKSVILVDNTALVIAGLGTSQYASGKFFNVDKAILIGIPGPDQLFQGNNKKSFAATLVDLEAVLKTAPAEKAKVRPVSNRQTSSMLIQLVLVGLVEQRLHFGDIEIRQLCMIVEHLGSAGQTFKIRPFVWIPELRSDDRLGALEEAFFHLDRHRDQRTLALCGQGRQPGFAGNEYRAAVDAQCFAKTGDQKEQPDAAGLQNVPIAVDPPVAEAIGNQQRPIINDVNESRRIASR